MGLVGFGLAASDCSFMTTTTILILRSFYHYYDYTTTLAMINVAITIIILRIKRLQNHGVLALSCGAVRAGPESNGVQGVQQAELCA